MNNKFVSVDSKSNRSAIAPRILQEILVRLNAVEKDEGVKILYACESGSRAWGFPSRDSDYDVRFVYVHPAEWYLSIDLEKKRDVIERPITDQIDLNGWDLRKALGLYRKSNPPLLEWLNSPIVYWETYGVAAKLRDVCATSLLSEVVYVSLSAHGIRQLPRVLERGAGVDQKILLCVAPPARGQLA